MKLVFNKHFKNDVYELFFNTRTGLEILTGINGNSDPFILQLPSLLDIGIMGTCKHKCVFCYQGHVDRPNMKLDDFKSIIDEVSYHVNQVALGGRGDPNHHENFKEIVEYCRVKNVVPNYTTSGIDLTDEQIEVSKLCGAVAVSEYSKDFTYKTLDKLINAGIKTNIHQIFSNKSFEKCTNIVLGNIPDEWKFNYEKLNAIIFLLFKPHGSGINLKWQPSVHQLKTFSKYIFDPHSTFKVGMDSCLINHVLKYGSPTEEQKMTIDTCEAARMSAYITPDMKFMPCSFADENKWSVKIENGLTPIWNNGEPFKKFREALEKNRDVCPLNL